MTAMSESQFIIYEQRVETVEGDRVLVSGGDARVHCGGSCALTGLSQAALYNRVDKLKSINCEDVPR